MAWFGLDKILLGYSLDDLQKQSNTLDAQIAQGNQANLDSGFWSQTQYDQAMADLAKGDVSTGSNNVLGSVNADFKSGAAEGFNNLASGVQSATNTLFGGLFKIFPWQVWIILALLLFFYMGGAKLLKGALAK